MTSANSQKVFFKTHSNTRGVTHRRGMHSNEYLEAQSLYNAHPLTAEQISILDKHLGGHTPRHLVGPAKRIAKMDPAHIPYPNRLARRQMGAIQAWYSMNWDHIYSYLVMSHDTTYVPPPQTYEPPPLPPVIDVPLPPKLQKYYSMNDPTGAVILEMLNQNPMPNSPMKEIPSTIFWTNKSVQL